MVNAGEIIRRIFSRSQRQRYLGALQSSKFVPQTDHDGFTRHNAFSEPVGLRVSQHTSTFSDTQVYMDDERWPFWKTAAFVVTFCGSFWIAVTFALFSLLG